MSLRIGIDIGSTTVKVVVLDESNQLLFRSYERHYSKARERAAETLRSIREKLAGQQVKLVVTGSAGLGVAKAAGLDFVQEVYATAAAVNLRRCTGGAHERFLCRRHRCVHRPDGYSDERDHRRVGRVIPEA